MSANKPPAETLVQAEQTCQGMDGGPSVPVETSENPPGELPAATERPQPPAGLPAATEIPQTPGRLPAATEIPQPPGRLPAATEIPQPPGGLPAATEIPQPPGGLPASTERPQPPGGLPAATERPQPPGGLPAATERPQPPGGLPAATERQQPPGGLPAATERPQPPGGLPAATERPQPPGGQPAATERPQPPAGLPAATERPQPSAGLPAATETPPLAGTLEDVAGPKAEPSIQVKATCFHHVAVSTACTSSGGTAAVQRNASNSCGSTAAAPKRTTMSAAAGPQATTTTTTPASVCIVSRVPTPGASGSTATAPSVGRMAQLVRPPWTPLAPGRTMVIALPRTTSPQAITVATRTLPQPAMASPQTITVVTRPPPQPGTASPQTITVATRTLPQPAMASPQTITVVTRPPPQPGTASPQTITVATRTLPQPAMASPQTITVVTRPSPQPVTASPQTITVATRTLPQPAMASPQTITVATRTLQQPTTASPRTITVATRPPPQPATASPRTITVATRPSPQSVTAQLPANFQIPAGMVLIRSESGQLMLVSQQALVQVQQGQRAASAAEPRPPSAPVQGAHVGDNKTPAVRKDDKVTIIRLAAPPSVHKTVAVAVSKPAPKAAVVQTLNAVVPPVRKAASQDPPPTITQETLENVKKCKNFLVTLIRLASSGSQSADITSNVKGLVKSLLDGSIEAEEFTAQLYKELKSTPQPYLLPFLKKSLPAVRHLTTDPQLFVQQADQPKPPKTTTLQLTSATTRPQAPGQLVIQQSKTVTLMRASLTRPAAQPGSSQNHNNRPASSMRHMVLQSRQQHAGPFAFKKPLVHNAPSNRVFNVNAGSYREDDDINDVASMAGVNLREEKAKIFSSACVAVGSVLQSCPDEPFLPGSLLLQYILHAGKCMGVTEVTPEVTAVLSHATQERLRGLLEKLTTMARHRKTLLKEDRSQVQVSDVRAQLSFMEDIETLKKRRQDEEERERLLRIARSRWTSDDPQFQQLKQQAKELQQLEQAQQLHREANITALAAIGTRKKRPLQTPGNHQVPVLCRVAPVQRVTRVTLRDLLVCLEDDPSLRHSVLLYRALLT